MATLNISLPAGLKAFVDEQVVLRDEGTACDYVSELIREDRDRQRLRALLHDGASSPPTEPVGDG